MLPFSETINAIAIDPSLNSSDVGTATHSIQAGGSTINFGNGFSNTSGLTLNGSTVASNDSRMHSHGGLNEAGSVFWNTPINIQAFTTSWIFQLSEAQANGYTFTIQNAPAGAAALGGDSAGLGYQGITKASRSNSTSITTKTKVTTRPASIPTVSRRSHRRLT